ncbi:MAG: hypothetical protein ABJE47_17520 [bacterium]
MKTRIGYLVLLLALSGAPLAAQRGGGGGGGGRGGGTGDRNLQRTSTPDIPSGSDIDKLDPIAMLVANQKDLGLTADDIGKLSGMDSELMRVTKASLRTVDSVHTALKAAAESPDSRGAIRETMAVYNKAVSDIRTLDDDASKRALALLTGDSQKKAEQLIQKRREEFDHVTKTKRPD